MALHLFIGAALVSWAPSQGAELTTAAISAAANASVSDLPDPVEQRAPAQSDDSLTSAISLALVDLSVEMSEVLSASLSRQPKISALPAPGAVVHVKWVSASCIGLLRPPKTLNSV